MKQDEKSGDTFFDVGFNLGNDEEPPFLEVPALHNHYDVLIECDYSLHTVDSFLITLTLDITRKTTFTIEWWLS